MPEMDGIEATRHIRAEVSPQHQPYIIAMTADVIQTSRERYFAVGMDGYISKPVKIEELVQALAKSKSAQVLQPELSGRNHSAGEDQDCCSTLGG